MSAHMQLDIVSAEASVFQGEATFVSATGEIGELGIAPGHTALITSLKPGQVTAQLVDGTEKVFYISGGFLEVHPESVTVLADTAARAEDLDGAAAEAARERAEKVLSEHKSGMEYSLAIAELAESVAQLRAIKALRNRTGRG